MSLLGKKVRLTGITQKGKNRVREFGETWIVFAETDRILFSPNQPGPWLFLSPMGLDQNSKASRWVKATADQDFVINEL